MSEKDRMLYYSLWGANTHHFIICIIAFSNAIWPECEGAYPFKVFFDDVCLMTPHPNYVKAVMVTIGYLCYDLAIILRYLGVNDPLTKQTIGHHFIGSVGSFIGMIAGYGITHTNNAALLTEVSTLFLNYRSMYPKDQIANTIP
eukprot:CAMPEP_0170496504 /NCGR_PEP_ID=MMETSP0208-20121228/21829_1 /TAXON_ID=197538 /ORGANISM="Strombidium inclinatum, Strain S3" /LENGTH=143 /DNA_ID=CAMNT_0010773065 /DNA_START=174 /DNA_END=605 /DNA_ORIENTATION=+